MGNHINPPQTKGKEIPHKDLKKDKNQGTIGAIQRKSQSHNESENPLKAEKRRKLKAIREKGLNPYPHDYRPSHKSIELVNQFEESLQAGESLPDNQVSLAGRLMTKRDMGKASFFDIQDSSGSFQIYIKIEELPELQRESFRLIDIGDIVGIKGFVFKTKKSQLSLRCQDFQILCKTLEPLPEKYHGLVDVEVKYRQRYLDLLMNPHSRKIFEKRSEIIRTIRRYLDNKGFLEVETPVLQPIYGGASAYPFSTQHRALNMKLYLKISPELYLKRLIVGGFEKVYEMGKNFRNEGIDRSHNPEFTMLEYYEAYTDYKYQMNQVEDMISSVAQEVNGSMKITFMDKEIDLSPPWRRLTVYDGIKEYGGFDPESLSDEELFKKIKELGSEIKQASSRGAMIMEAFELCVEEHLWEPTFVIDHPVEVSPLTKSHREKEGLVERFEPFIANMEIGNAYTELNDPEEQLQRLQQQETERVVDEEAQPMDEDFIKAMDVGMPPTGGVGIGIERVIMLLTGEPSIRDIILFPTMKPIK